MVADLQIEAEEANGGVLLTVVDSARLTMLLTRETAAELLDALRWPDLTSEKRRRAPFLNLLKSFYILLGPPQPYSPNGFRTVLSTKGERT